MWRAATSVGLAFTVGGGAWELLGGVLRGYAENAALGCMGLSLLAASQYLGIRRRGSLRTVGLPYTSALTPLVR